MGRQNSASSLFIVLHSNATAVYLLVEIAGELNLALENLLVDGHRIIVIEGVNAGEHLVREDAERPPVDGLSVALIEEHFGR